MSDYFDGAVMAYRDAKEFVENLIKGLPEELKFIAPSFQIIAEGFGEKANNVVMMKNAAINNIGES